VNPEYMQLLITHQVGRYMAYTALIMELLGVLMIRKIVSIRV